MNNERFITNLTIEDLDLLISKIDQRRYEIDCKEKEAEVEYQARIAAMNDCNNCGKYMTCRERRTKCDSCGDFYD